MTNRWEDILVRIRRSQRYLPALSRVRVASDEVTDRWEELAKQSGRLMLGQLWELIVRKGGDVSLRSRDWCRVPTLFFSDFDEEHRKLCAFPDVFRRLLLSAEEGVEPQRVRDMALKDFFVAYPTEAFVPDLFPEIRRFFLSDTSEHIMQLSDRGYFSEDAVAITAGRVPPDSLVTDFLLRDGGEAVTNGRFAFLVWCASIPRYANLLSQHKDRLTVKEAVEFIHLDFRAMQEKRGVGLGERVALATVLLGWFNEEMSNPTEEVQEVLFHCLTDLLGDPKEKEAKANWARLPEELRAFFNHLALGRSLNELFDFTDEFLRANALDSARWRPRKRFWMRYWRDRRVLAAKAYIGQNEWVPQYWRDKISMGKFYRSGGRVLIVIELEDGVTAFEFSHQGALRFSPRFQTPTRRESWDFDDVKFYTDEATKVNHTTGWEGRADEQLERLTGRPSPRH